MRTLIDGYNLMHARGLMERDFGPDGLRRARTRFLDDLAASLGPLDSAGAVVVFDAAHPPPDRPDRAKHKGLTILFAVDDEDADARIEAILASHPTPKAVTVVSTDHRVRVAAIRKGARSLSCDEFLSQVADRGRKKKEAPAPALSPEETARQQGPSAAEAAFWMNTFAHVDEEPGLRDAPGDGFAPTDDEIARIVREVEGEPPGGGRKKRS